MAPRTPSDAAPRSALRPAAAVIAGVLALAFPGPAHAATFAVNTAADPGSGGCDVVECTLREAIVAANSAAGVDTVAFDIAGPGPHTITPASPLPGICCDVAAMVIDATTQPGYAGTPLIELNGAVAGGNGLHIAVGPSIVRGLAINRFATGIDLDNRGGGGHLVERNFIGVDPTGTMARPNTGPGIEFACCNAFEAAPYGHTIKDNLVSGNGGAGIDSGFGNPNAVRDTVIQGNRIGTDAAGTSAIPNANAGIRIFGAGSNTIGGTAPGEGNTIAFNLGDGIAVVTAATINPVGNRVRANSIFSNGGLGIDLANDGVTPNDEDDSDAGPNALQNAPLLTTVSGTAVDGTLNSTPSASFTIDFFASGSCDASGSGEGDVYVGSQVVSTDAGGDAVIDATTTQAAARVTATATNDATGDTSEFSNCVAAPEPVAMPANSTAPSIPTSATAGTQIGCDPGVWSGSPAFGFQWLRNLLEVGTGQTYTLVEGDVGQPVVCRVTATNAGGSAVADSNTLVPTALSANPTPKPTPTPTPSPPPPTPTPSPPPPPPPPPSAPTATVQETRLAQAPASQVAAAFGLPSTRQCVSRRRFTIRLRRPRGVTIAAVRVIVNGKAVRTRKVDGRSTAVVDLRGLPKGRFTVQIRVLTASGKTLHGTRRYRTCARRD